MQLSLASFNATAFLLAAGYFGLFCLIFAETGLVIGLILPGGETLAFAAGFLSSLGFFNIVIIIAIVFCAAVLADSVEYALGRKYGKKVFDKKQSLFFDEIYVQESEDFYKRHGGKTILIARFIPFVRTLAPLFAGIGKMRYGLFVFYNITGALFWAIGISLLGYYLGKAIPNAGQYAFWIVLAIAAIALLSPLVALFHNKEQRQRLAAFIKARTGAK